MPKSVLDHPSRNTRRTASGLSPAIRFRRNQGPLPVLR